MYIHRYNCVSIIINHAYNVTYNIRTHTHIPFILPHLNNCFNKPILEFRYQLKLNLDISFIQAFYIINCKEVQSVKINKKPKQSLLNRQND